MTQIRRAGVLMPVSSFTGTLGIGDFGASAYEWIDTLAETGASIWQILPLNPVGYGNSPYQTYSAFAGDEIYISIEALYKDLGLEFDVEPVMANAVDFSSVRERKSHLLAHAYKHFKKDEDYKSFLITAHNWLEDYVKFITLKRANDLKSWTEWTVFEADESLMEYERFVQYVFYKQWMALKGHANKHKIEVVGDIPIYLGHDSAEVYFNRDLFYLEADGSPSLVAGVPPDFFSTEGQLWGNPIYRWDAMKENGYSFWVDRLAWNQHCYDVVRVDHFRAFDTYWVIDGKADTAKDGEWLIGPRNDFFDAMYDSIPDLKLVVEDLGDLRPEVLELRDDYNLMGMKIIEFMLNKYDLDNSHEYGKNFLAYTGTHDNQTIPGWLKELSKEEYDDLYKNLEAMGFDEKEPWQKINHYTLALPVNWAILPMQDILGLDNSARINTPASIGSPNWEWKLLNNDGMQDAMNEFARIIKLTNRNI